MINESTPTATHAAPGATTKTDPKPRRGKGQGALVKRTLPSGAVRWDATLSLPAAASPDGKRLQRSKTFTTRKAGQEWLNEQLGALATGTAAHDRGMSLAAWIDRWLQDQAAKNRRPSTLTGYRQALDSHVLPYIGTVRLADLTPAHLATARRRVNEANATRQRPVTAATHARTNAVLRSALNAARRQRLISGNPAADTVPDLPTVTKFRGQAWTPEQATRFLSDPAVTQDRLFVLYSLCLRRGLRRGEALGLRPQDLDLDSPTPTATINQTVTQTGSKIRRGPAKTSGSHRTVPLGADLAAMLRSHLARRAAERLAAGTHWQGDPEIFTDSRGTVHQPGYVTVHFDRLIKAVNKAATTATGAGTGTGPASAKSADQTTPPALPRVRLHDLRHTAATLALREGVPMKVVSRMLGHSQLAVTADTYSHVDTSMLTAATSALDAALAR